MNQSSTFTRPREPHSHFAPPVISNGQWDVKYVRTPGNARAAFGRHERSHTAFTAKNIGAREPNSGAAVKFVLKCDEGGCRQAWVVPLTN